MNQASLSYTVAIGLAVGVQMTTIIFTLLLSYRIPFPGAHAVRYWVIASLGTPVVSFALFGTRFDDIYLRDVTIFAVLYAAVTQYLSGFLHLYRIPLPPYAWRVGALLTLAYAILLAFENSFWIRVVCCSGMLVAFWAISLRYCALVLLRQEDARLPVVLMATGALLALVGALIRMGGALELRDAFMQVANSTRLDGPRYFMVTLAGILVGTIGVLIGSFERVYAQARHAELHDELTDLPKRSVVEAFAESEFERARQDGRAVVIALVDIDGYRQIKRLRGYVVGTEAQRALARLLRPLCRRAEQLGRFSDGLFCLVLPDEEDGDAVGRMLIERVAKQNFPGLPPLTVCCGIVTVPPDLPVPATCMMLRQLAQRSLSEAKLLGAGQYRTVLAGA